MNFLANLTKLQRGVLATGGAATIFLGVTYGAGLKTQKELEVVRDPSYLSLPPLSISSSIAER
jgi:hypothetical protein